jgi:hypothetical protein
MNNNKYSSNCCTTILPPSVNRLSRECGILDVSTLWTSTACYRDSFTTTTAAAAAATAVAAYYYYYY